MHLESGAEAAISVIAKHCREAKALISSAERYKREHNYLAAAQCYCKVVSICCLAHYQVEKANIPYFYNRHDHIDEVNELLAFYQKMTGKHMLQA